MRYLGLGAPLQCVDWTERRDPLRHFRSPAYTRSLWLSAKNLGCRLLGKFGASARPRSFEPPRMIEVRPGWWISTYDCVSDEGQGRWRPCSALGLN
jgi:hypothetical protein